MDNSGAHPGYMMAKRIEDADSLDFFPTPPWATRALVEKVIGPGNASGLECLEPACGMGHMARPLAEYFRAVDAFDIHPYGYGMVADFLAAPGNRCWDWVITNPPFNLAEQFAVKARSLCRHGVALLVRTQFLETVGRYNRLFKSDPPNITAIFTERVPMLKGRISKTATTATSYCWLIWLQERNIHPPRLEWIPPCRKELERDGDYD